MKNMYLTLPLLRRLGAGAMLMLGITLSGRAQYCTTGLYVNGCSFGDDINDFTLGTGGSLINTTATGCTGGTAGYADYTSINPSVAPNQVIPFTFTTSYGCCEGLAIWIDFNDNYVFEASEKLYASATTIGSVNSTITIPAAALGGTHRMRVRDAWNIAGTGIDACTSYGYGEVHDYSITVVVPPCAAPITGGTAVASQPSYCPVSPVNISVTGATIGGGLLYQWQSSTSGLPGSWTDVAGATGAGFSAVQTGPTNYRRRMICPAGPDTAYSTVVFADVTPYLNCYCTSSAVNGGDEDIVLVQAGALNNSSTANCDVYTDFTALTPVSLFKGLSYPVRVDVGDCNGPTYYANGVAVFIDYNHNGDFSDAGERVFFTPVQPAAAVLTHAGSFSVPLSAQTGIARMRVIAVEGGDGALISPCGTYGYGETEDYLVSIQPQPANEVKLISIDNPGIAACAFNNNLLVTLKNNGSAALTAATFDVNTGGLVQAGLVWNGNIASGATQQIQVPGTFVFNDGDTLGVTVRLPNGVADTDTTDNKQGLRTWLALSGIYKVGYGVNGNDSIADIPTAISQLELRGVCDTVYFDLRSGTYTGHYLVQQYPGWSAGKMAIFRSETQNAADVILTDSITAASDNYIFRLDGADGIGFQHVTMRQKSAAFRTAIDLLNGAHYLFVDNSRLLADTSLSGSSTSNFDQILIRSANATTDNHSTITHNLLSGGSRAINLGAATGEYESGHTISGNTIEKISFLSVILNGMNGITVENNTIKVAPYTNLANPLGIQYSGSIGGGTISGNHVTSNKEGSSILLSNVKGGVSPVLVSNNFIYSSDSTNATGHAPISVFDVNTTDVTIANNSISYFGNNISYGGIYVADGSNIALYNNNIGAWNNGYAVKIDKTYSLQASDNNNFYTEGAQYAIYAGTGYTNLSGWQSGTGFDAASLSVNPGFNGTDLHTCTPQLNAAGMALALVSKDFDGDIRYSMPDIGGDEFFGGPEGLITTEDDFLKCPSESVSFGGTAISGVSYSWNPGGATTSTISTTAAGTYIITGTSACGSFSDTVMVANKPLPVASFTTANSFGLSAAFNNTSTNANSYMWNFGDGSTSTDVNPTHIYSSGDTYVITLTAYGDCDTVTTTQTYTAVAFGLSESGSGSIGVYPNPAVESVNISFNGTASGMAQFVITDMSGKVAGRYESAISSGSIYTIDITSLAVGVYDVSVTLNDETTHLRIIRK
ncbi:MAG: GEVED domain-containing protein [Flavobacteriales bacterium]